MAIKKFMRKIMNKSGKGELKIVGIVLVSVLILGALFYFMIGTKQVVVGGEDQTGTIVAGCGVNPSVVNSFTSTYTPGDIVSGSTYFRLNGQYIGTTSPTTVGTADVLIVNSSQYLSKIKTGFKVNCNANQLVETLDEFANATLTYYGDNGIISLVDATQNETIKAAGASYNWKLHFQGNDKKSTGKMLMIVELSVPANVSSLTLNGGQSVTVPNGYTRQLTNGYVAAFLLPAITGNNAVDYNLAAVSASGQIIGGYVYTTIYHVQPFVETDGTFSDSGLAFNSLNTAKYHDVQTKNFQIV